METRKRFPNRHSKAINASEIKSLSPLAQAFDELNIDAEKFAAIHTLELKKEHLFYKYLLKEFMLVASIYKDQPFITNNPLFVDKLKTAKDAHDLILNSSYITEHKQIYSKHSIGLTEIDTRSLLKHEFNYQSEHEMLKSSIFVAKKDIGIAPGFKAIYFKPILLALYYQFLDENERIKYLIDNDIFDLEKIYSTFKSKIPMMVMKSSCLVKNG